MKQGTEADDRWRTHITDTVKRGQNGATPYSANIHWVHEVGYHTPLVAHWLKELPENYKGNLEHQPSHLIDLMATCVDLAKADYPKEANGRKIVPLQGYP